jgi:DNA-binding response OmpR family regulator
LRRGDVIAYVGDTGNIKKGLGAGAQAYLVKPNFDNLKATIDRLIDEAGLTHSVMM